MLSLNSSPSAKRKSRIRGAVISYLLDTSALLAHYLDETGTLKVEEILDDGGAAVYISSLSIAEFARRVLAICADPSKARSDALIYAGLASRIIPVDTAIAIRACELASASSSRLPLADSLIAACALASESILVHRDAHFDALPAWGPERISLLSE
jgi:predicted nucleic acid-binding protein